MKFWWKKLIGWWRLKFGFCPLCYSSPPAPNCPVCLGSYEYGRVASAYMRERWHRRYLNYLTNPERPTCDYEYMSLCLPPYYMSNHEDLIVCESHKDHYERANPELNHKWTMIYDSRQKPA